MDYKNFDVQYISQRRPRQNILLFFLKYNDLIIGAIASIIFFVSVNDKYYSVLIAFLLLAYCIYLFLKRAVKSQNKWKEIYFSEKVSFIRALIIVVSITIFQLLPLFFKQSNEFQSITKSTFWLFYLFPLIITCQRGSTISFLTLLVLIIFSIYITDPDINLLNLVTDDFPISNLFITRSLWISLISLLFYVNTRYLVNFYLNIGIIHRIQEELNNFELKALANSLLKKDKLKKYYQIVTDGISLEFKFPTVLILYRNFENEYKVISINKNNPLDLNIRNENIRINDFQILKSINKSEIFLSNDLEKDNIKIHYPNQNSINSELIIPLKRGNKNFGIIDILSTEKNSFLPQDIRAIEIICENLMDETENARFYFRRERISKLLEIINSKILDKSEINKLLERISNIAHQEMSSDLTILFLLDPHKRSMEFIHTNGKQISKKDFFELLPLPRLLKLITLLQKSEDKKEKEVILDERENTQKIKLEKKILEKFSQYEGIKKVYQFPIFNRGICTGILLSFFRRDIKLNYSDIETIYTLTNLIELIGQKEKTFEQIITAERENYASNLHDSFTSIIFGMREYLDAIESPDSKTNQIINNLNRSLIHMQNSIHWIKNTSSIQYKGNLNKEVQELVNIAKELYKVRIEVVIEEDININNIFISNQLMMILTEAIGNSVRHGKATYIKLEISKEPQNLNVNIFDNGIGLDKETIEISDGGIKNMRNRVDEMNGAMVFNSRRKDGTLISIKVPL